MNEYKTYFKFLSQSCRTEHLAHVHTADIKHGTQATYCR